MDVRSLPRDCIVELKRNYIVELDEEGTFGEIVHNDPSYGHPAWSDIAYADELILDDIIFEHYDGISFVKDDFFCMMETSYEEWDKMELEGVV